MLKTTNKLLKTELFYITGRLKLLFLHSRFVYVLLYLTQLYFILLYTSVCGSAGGVMQLLIC